MIVSAGVNDDREPISIHEAAIAGQRQPRAEELSSGATVRALNVPVPWLAIRPHGEGRARVSSR